MSDEQAVARASLREVFELNAETVDARAHDCLLTLAAFILEKGPTPEAKTALADLHAIFDSQHSLVVNLFHVSTQQGS